MKVTIFKAIGTSLREARISANLSQPKVKEITGIAVESISIIENGRTNPTIKTIYTLAKAYGASLEEIFSRVDPKNDDPTSVRRLESEISQNLHSLCEDDLQIVSRFIDSLVNYRND